MSARLGLHAALKHADPIVAPTAARLLAEIEDRESIPALIDFVLHSRSYAKTAGLNALRSLDAQDAIPAFEQLCADPYVPDDFYWYGHKGVRASAAVHLLSWGNTAGERFLQELLDNKDRVILRDFTATILQIKNQAAEGIQKQLSFEALWDEAQTVSLQDTAYTDASQLCSLCEAMAFVDDERADQCLRYYMDYYSRYVRGEAYKSLYRRHGDAVVAEITDSVNRHNTDFDRVVLGLISKDGDALKQIAESAQQAFDRTAALHALAEIEAPCDETLALSFINKSVGDEIYGALEWIVQTQSYDIALPERSNDALYDVYVNVLALKKELAPC